jgi:hypothetical protein
MSVKCSLHMLQATCSRQESCIYSHEVEQEIRVSTLLGLHQPGSSSPGRIKIPDVNINHGLQIPVIAAFHRETARRSPCIWYVVDELNYICLDHVLSIITYPLR